MPLISAFLKPLQEMDANSRKRKADQLEAGDQPSKGGDRVVSDSKPDVDDSAIDETADQIHSTPSKRARTGSSSSLSSIGSLSELDSSTDSPSPHRTPHDSRINNLTPIKSSLGSSTTTPSGGKATLSSTKGPNRRKRLTPTEKKAREEEMEKKRQEKQQERDKKKKDSDEKKAADAAEKAQKKKEREEKKALADAEKHARDQEREAKRAKKEDEERKVREEKEKKERSQLKLNSFFKVPASTPSKPKPAEESTSSTTPTTRPDPKDSPVKKQAPPQQSTYDKMFQPFFVKAGVQLAKSPFEMDEETKSVKSNILDEYILGRRGDLECKKFNAVQVFGLLGPPKPRGILHEPVKVTVERLRHQTQRAEARGDIKEQERIQRDAQRRLARISLKSIRFQQDVRPAYLGTITQIPHDVGLPRMRKLARKPAQPILPLNYDYDSEAEWQEEEGEDLDGDDEDDEDLDDGDEVGELIDDSEAVDLMRFGAVGLEPQSTGICWEDRKRAGPCVTARQHRLEFIMTDRLQHSHSIDPFSSAYWEPDAATKPKTTATNAFQQIGSCSAANAVDADKTKPKKPVVHAGLPIGLSDEDLTKIKQSIKSTFESTPAISKLGMLELLKSSGLKGVKVNGKDISRNDVKIVIDVVALRKKKANEVTWCLKPEHAL